MLPLEKPPPESGSSDGPAPLGERSGDVEDACDACGATGVPLEPVEMRSKQGGRFQMLVCPACRRRRRRRS